MTILYPPCRRAQCRPLSSHEHRPESAIQCSQPHLHHVMDVSDSDSGSGSMHRQIAVSPGCVRVAIVHTLQHSQTYIACSPQYAHVTMHALWWSSFLSRLLCFCFSSTITKSNRPLYVHVSNGGQFNSTQIACSAVARLLPLLALMLNTCNAGSCSFRYTSETVRRDCILIVIMNE